MKKRIGPVLSVSHFKATCLEVLERVRRTGRSVVITKRGAPLAEVVPPSTAATGADWMGSLRGTAHIVGDIIEPVVAREEWDVERT